MKRVWFNHWFSSIYHVINLLREDKNETYEIYVSWNREHELMKAIADDFFLEPEGLDSDDYVTWCFEQCNKRKIDIFIPRIERLEISKHITEFNSIGTKLMVEKHNIMSLFNSKIATYHELGDYSDLQSLVPKYRLVENKEDFTRGVDELRNYGVDRFVIKKAVDEGGTSFISFNGGNCIPDNFNEPYILMEYLKDEVTCDCVTCREDIYTIFRKKLGFSVHQVMRNDCVEEKARMLIERFGLKMPSSIQFRHTKEGELKLLEINTRMSGGIQISSLGCGINLPLLAVEGLLGKKDYNGIALDKLKSLGDNPVTLSNIDTPNIIA